MNWKRNLTKVGTRGTVSSIATNNNSGNLLWEMVWELIKLLQNGDLDINFDPQKSMDSNEEANFVPCFMGDGIEIEQITAEWRP